MYSKKYIMELPWIGRRCYVCKTLDYLPFRCESCRHHYCKEHRSHGCQLPRKVIQNPKDSQDNLCPYCRSRHGAIIQCNICGIKTCPKHRYHDLHQGKTKENSKSIVR